MDAVKQERLSLTAEEEMVLVRQTARAWTTNLGFGLVDQTKMVTAASELARNALYHGGGGTVTFEELRDGRKKGLRIVFEDEGPGIPDPDLAMSDGYTTGEGLGLGLGGAKRLVNNFEIHSEPGHGTRVAITRWN